MAWSAPLFVDDRLIVCRTSDSSLHFVEPKTGRDNFARWVHGARPSLAVSFVATVFGTGVGVVMERSVAGGEELVELIYFTKG